MPCHGRGGSGTSGPPAASAGSSLWAGTAPDAPDQAEPFQQADDAEAEIDLPPEEARLGGVRVVVVVVVPAVAQGHSASMRLLRLLSAVA